MARKIAHNSAIKIKATTGREVNTSKSGKTAAQPTLSLDLDPSVYMRTNGEYNCACSKAEDRNSEGKWEGLTSFDKNKQIRTRGKSPRRGNSEFELQNAKIHDARIQQLRVNQKSKSP